MMNDMIMLKNKIKTNLPYLFIGVFLERVEVAPHCSFKHGWFLWNNAQPRPKIMDSYRADVNAIDHDSTRNGVYNSEESLNQSRFPATGSSYNASPRSTRESTGNASQNKRHVWSVTNLYNPQNQTNHIIFFSIMIM